eukprot:jgi/Hompol1/6987/HPOL_005144-RA
MSAHPPQAQLPPALYAAPYPYAAFTTVPHRLRRDQHLRLLEIAQLAETSQLLRRAGGATSPPLTGSSGFTGSISTLSSVSNTSHISTISYASDATSTSYVDTAAVAALHELVAADIARKDAAVTDLFSSYTSQQETHERSEAIGRLLRMRPDLERVPADQLDVLRVTSEIRKQTRTVSTGHTTTNLASVPTTH